MKHVDDYAVDDRTSGRMLTELGDEDNKYLTGYIVTPHGIAVIYAENNRKGYIRVDFVHGGRLHMLSIHGQQYTKRGVVTIAGRFVREVASL